MTFDPWLFSRDAIDDDTAAFNAELRARLAEAPDPTTFPPAMLRAARERGESAFGYFEPSPRGEDRLIEAGGHQVGIRQILPRTEPRGVFLHIHGGGWMLGAAYEQDLRNQQIADALGLVSVSVEYRLAPEHPYPAAPDDCEAASLWLIQNALTEYGTDRLTIGGESAGGHLAAVTLLRMRDRHGYTGFRAANLVYGVYDVAMTPSSANWGDENLILSTPIIEFFGQAFVDHSLTREPDVSPLFAELGDLPPALFTVGTLDPLLDDTLFMSERWAAAGNQTEVAVYPGGVHAFDYFDIPLGHAATARMIEFLGAYV